MAGVTENKYGKGTLTYIGTYPSQELLNTIVKRVAVEAGVTSPENYSFPIVLRSGVNKAGRNIRYVFNYSGEAKELSYIYPDAKELISGKSVKSGEPVSLGPWEVLIMEEK